VTEPAAWLDVSLPISSTMPVFPGDPKVVVEPAPVPEGAPYHLSHIEMGSHTGTHVDAPAHFIRGGKELPDIPLTRWSGPCWVVQLPLADAITPEALQAAWPGEAVERLLLKTPNSDLWGTPRAGKVWQALTPAAADWLVARGVRLVGIDALSIEKDESGQFPVHHILLGQDVLIVEGLDLRAVVPGPYEFLCLPLKLDAIDGAPARIALRRR
jgi:arylformamidase